MSEKIKSHHLERTAYVYVRQSCMHQVRNNRESRRRQYELKNRAHKFGFPKVEVIDDDLGISGTGSKERPGFGRLLAAVCEGRVGAVLALEASRLARNNRDWHHLLDLCAMTETLVIDHDGVYNSSQMNDRLLLGLKGTMSEFELGLLRERAQEALREKIRRGEVLTEVPVGYVRTEDNRVEMTPDRQVQDAIRGVFAKFDEYGSARQVLLWYRLERIPFPTYQWSEGRVQVVWRLPTYSRILSILQNPIYAGAFVYGRTQSKTSVVDGRARKTRGHKVPREEWEVLIRDHHPGYISWEKYLANQKQLELNAAVFGKMTTGAAKRGAALLAGLLRCGRCGRKLHVGYSGVGGRAPRYYCRGASINHGEKRCISFGGLRVDREVVRTVLDALQPAGVEASFDAWKKATEEDDEKRKAFALAVEKARYEVERTRRQYDAVDPENRLVAAELEGRWNEALKRLAEAETRLEVADADEEKLAEEDRKRLLELGQDLEELWNHPDAPIPLKKRILRTVLEEIVADVSEDSSQVILYLHWAGGVHMQIKVQKAKTGCHGHSTDREVNELVRDLAKVCDDPSIAAVLNRLGYRTGTKNTWTQTRVRSLRSYRDIPPFDKSANRPWVTLVEAARILNVSPSVVRRLIKQSILPAKQVVRHAPWVIARKDLELPEVISAARAVHEGRRPPRTAEGQAVMPFKSTM